MRSTVAWDQAKQMMGRGNPNTGSATRATASTQCSSCGRWHRLGTVCFNQKSLITKGDQVHHTDVSRGNPYREGGKFGSQPGGEAGKQARNEFDQACSELEENTSMTAVDRPFHDFSEITEQARMVGEQNPVTDVEGTTPFEQPQPIDPPATIQAQSLLNWKPEAAPQPSLAEQQAQLVQSSAHLSGQEAAYLNALRRWQAAYGGNRE